MNSIDIISIICVVFVISYTYFQRRVETFIVRDSRGSRGLRSRGSRGSRGSRSTTRTTTIAAMTTIINTKINALTQWVRQVQAGNDAKHADIYKRLIIVEEEMNEDMDIDSMEF